MGDIIDEIEAFIPKEEPKKWAKLSSTIQYRRLQLLLLKEILAEMRKISTELEEIRKDLKTKPTTQS